MDEWNDILYLSPYKILFVCSFVTKQNSTKSHCIFPMDEMNNKKMREKDTEGEREREPFSTDDTTMQV